MQTGALFLFGLVSFIQPAFGQAVDPIDPCQPVSMHQPATDGKDQGQGSPDVEDAGLDWGPAKVIVAVAGVLIATATLILRVRRGKPGPKIREERLKTFSRHQEEKMLAEEELQRAAESESQIYERQLRGECETIQLLGSGEIPNIKVPTLSTFVSLSMTDRGDAETPSGERGGIIDSEHAMNRAFQLGRVLLVLGEAGSGKTTLLKYYVMACLTEDRYQALGMHEHPRPILLPVRQLWPKDQTPEPLPENLRRWTLKHHHGVEAQQFESWLSRPNAIVFLDGLDEISDIEQRRRVCRWIDAAVHAYDHARFVITSRRTGYRRTDKVTLACNPIELQIEDFTSDQQMEFLKRWFTQASVNRRPLKCEVPLNQWREKQATKALGRAQTVITYLTQPENAAIQDLARIPLMLQIIAILWKDREHLPQARSDLYRHALNYLLFDRDAERSVIAGNEDLKPDLSAEQSLRVLRPVSLWMQKKKQADEVEQRQFHSQTQKKLRVVHGSLTPAQYCDWLRDRSGLIVNCGDKHYAFSHKSFREYLAGYHLLELCKRDAKRISEAANYFGDAWWEESVRFLLTAADEDIFDAFMDALLKRECMAEPTELQRGLLRHVFSEAQEPCTKAIVRSLMDDSDSVSVKQKECILRDCLRTMARRGFGEAYTAIMHHLEACSGATVRTAREILVDDCQIEVKRDISKLIPLGSYVCRLELNAEYILVPGGSYTYSLDKQTKEVANLYFARYPVTNKRYRQFVQYLKSEHDQWQTLLPLPRFAEILVEQYAVPGLQDYLAAESADWGKKLVSQRDSDRRFGGDDQPVVSITWYSAHIYCAWLTELHRAGTNDPDAPRMKFRLPNEVEWEWAAGGGARAYPWGNQEPSDKLANYNQHTQATTPVGQYPDGATPEGLMDMAGNVWEWMANYYDNNKDRIALRGGDWYDDAKLLLCSARYYYLPVGRDYDVGFRVVCSQS